MSQDATPKLSPVEGIKTASRFLRGTIAEELSQDTDHFNEEAKQLLKFHGSYQQEDRDARKNRSKAGVGKAYMMMIRLKLPGGKLTADQYLAMDDLAQKYANGTLRLTTRQSIQFHGVLKSNLKATIAGINHALLSTLGACGDVNRNVVSCPAPTGDAARLQMLKLAQDIAKHLAPRAGQASYFDIWLNGERQTPAETEEPIYGQTYLPRKFKVGFSLPYDNCTDILAQCLGFQCVVREGQPIGYNMFCGGGQGMTNSKPDTYPLLGQPICFLTPEEVVPAAEAVAKLFRDHGNRADRKRARFKYVVHDLGVEKFRELFARDYWKKPLAPLADVEIVGLDLHLGWHRQLDGKYFLGISVENGRVKDEGTLQLRTAVRKIVSQFKASVRISCQQDLLLADVNEADRPAIDAILAEHGVPQHENLSMARKWSMACPAIPTCALAITESERALPAMVRELERELTALGLQGEPISVRMTGCPNGCARPYQSEIGLVGRSGDKYTVYIGGDSYGRRISTELQDLVPRDQIVPKLTKVFQAFAAERNGKELFGDFCTRVGMDRLKSLVS
ncbi:MAG: NADPH-dependent assimilatory sulfite reductase hemoprotein subunit [Gemmataceae bacterium]